MPGSSVAGDNRSNNDQDHSEDDVKSPAGAGSVLSERASTAIEHRLYGCIRDNLGRCWMNPYCAKTNPKVKLYGELRYGLHGRPISTLHTE